MVHTSISVNGELKERLELAACSSNTSSFCTRSDCRFSPVGVKETQSVVCEMNGIERILLTLENVDIDVSWFSARADKVARIVATVVQFGASNDET